MEEEPRFSEWFQRTVQNGMKSKRPFPAFQAVGSFIIIKLREQHSFSRVLSSLLLSFRYPLINKSQMK